MPAHHESLGVRALGNDPAEQPIRICLQSDPGQLPQVREAVLRVAADAGFTEDEIDRIILATDEAIANVIKHGYGGRLDQPVEVCMEQIEQDGCRGLKMVIRDFGKQVPPDQICGRDLDDIRPGGLGVHIIRSVMDHVAYSPAEGGGMRLEMVKLKRT